MTKQRRLRLLQQLGEVAALRKLLKERTMIYQYEAKVRVARHFGLEFAEVNVAYVDWAKLRERYRAETGCDP